MGRVLLAALPEPDLTSYVDNTRFEKLTARTKTDPDELRAELRRVAEQGYAVVDGEREEGVRSAAAPVRGANGRVLAALNVSANAGRVSLDELRDRFVPRLLETADAITEDIAGLH
jgi:IclR family pca regulon transcriptional regulator